MKKEFFDKKMEKSQPAVLAKDLDEDYIMERQNRRCSGACHIAFPPLVTVPGRPESLVLIISVKRRRRLAALGFCLFTTTMNLKDMLHESQSIGQTQM